MGRILAIDYGMKRCGVAVSDELRIIAQPLTAVATHELPAFLQKYCTANEVDVMVIGKPVDMHGHASEIEKFIVQFINRMKKLLPMLRVERYDERFTSQMALQSMITAGSTKSDRSNKGNIDMVSAALILQDYMHYNHR